MKDTKEVKRIFFLNGEHLKNIQGHNGFIMAGNSKNYPCYELEDGTILYPHYGCPANGEIWYQTLN